MAVIVIIAVLSIAGIFSIGRCSRNNDTKTEIIVEVDTLYIRDTICIEKPNPKLIKVIDTLLVEVTDTVRIKDTVYLNIPIEQKYYRSKDYEAWVSGYRPALDSLNLFTNTVQLINTTSISQTQKRKHWGIGIQAGYGFTLHQNQLRPAPYVGIGLSYNIIIF